MEIVAIQQDGYDFILHGTFSCLFQIKNQNGIKLKTKICSMAPITSFVIFFCFELLDLSSLISVILQSFLTGLELLVESMSNIKNNDKENLSYFYDFQIL